MARNPNDTAVEKEYIFEIYGEITVSDYSEEQAKRQLEENLRDLLADAIRDDKVEVR